MQLCRSTVRVQRATSLLLMHDITIKFSCFFALSLLCERHNAVIIREIMIYDLLYAMSHNIDE